jgi:hypothetical protein
MRAPDDGSAGGHAQAARQGEGTRLQAQAFEAINEVVRCASPDTLPMVGQLIPLMINKLNETLQAQAATSEALERQSEIQVCSDNVHMFGVCVNSWAATMYANPWLQYWLRRHVLPVLDFAANTWTET